MKSYTKIYLDYFGYGETDFVPCEICGNRAVDISHIIPRSQRKDLLNSIENLMGSCRKCHNDYGDKKQFVEMLQKIHLKFMEVNGRGKKIV